MSAKTKSFVYIIKAGLGAKSPIKVGVANNVQKRIKQLQTGNPFELLLVMHFECNDRRHAFHVEKTIHEILDGQRLCGEWFRVSKSRLMKVINGLGSKHEIECLTQEMDLFERQQAGIAASLRKKVRSRDKEVWDLKLAIKRGKLARKAYIDKLLQLDVTYEEIARLKNKSKTVDD
ncbi:MAG: GIY-YIG nuclease family protein [Nitrosomonadaceae bacterium]